MTQRPDGTKGVPWELKGFDTSVPEPDVVIFRPNRKRSRALAGALVFTSVFFSFFGLAPVVIWLGMLGIIPASSSGPLPTFFQNPPLFIVMMVAALATFAAVLSPLILLFHDEIWHRLTPIILDRRQDQLLYGTHMVCRLSEIDRVILRQLIPQHADQPPVYGVAVCLRSGRRIPTLGIKGIIVRYALGPQEPDVKQTFQEIADFIGAEFELRPERKNYGSSPNPRGM